MTTINRLYVLKKERWEDDRPSGKQMVIKIRQPKKTMNWNGLQPKKEEERCMENA